MTLKGEMAHAHDQQVVAGFEGWYREQHAAVLAGLTVALGDRELAEEAAAEAFTRAYERWGRVQRMASPAGWAFRVGQNWAKRHRRRRALERALLGRHRSPEPDPDPLVVAPELWSAVKALPDRQRTAIALRYLADLSQAEVAAHMGVAPGTAGAALTHARRRLARTLREETHHG